LATRVVVAPAVRLEDGETLAVAEYA